ncbi:MAG: hypothetical protein VX642_04945 [Bdellovibrionota bacterium]|nr:hypothetical protein [Bdellovibrionota bacterium]
MKNLYFLILFNFIWIGQGKADYVIAVNLMTEFEKCMKKNELVKTIFPKLKCSYQDPTNLFSFDYEIYLNDRTARRLYSSHTNIGDNRTLADYDYIRVNFDINWKKGIRPIRISPTFKANQDLSLVDEFINKTTNDHFLGSNQSLAASNHSDKMSFETYGCHVKFHDANLRSLTGEVSIDGQSKSEYKIFYGTTPFNSFFSSFDETRAARCDQQMSLPNIAFKEKIELVNFFPETVKFYYPDKIGDIHPYSLRKRQDIRKVLKKTSLLFELVGATYAEIDYFHSQLQSRLRENYQKAFDYCFESSEKLSKNNELEALNQESRNSIRELLNCVELISPLLKLHEGSYLDDQVVGVFGVREFFLDSFGWQHSSQGLPSLKMVASFEQILSNLNFLRDTYELQIPSVYKSKAGKELEMELMGQLNHLQSFQAEIAGDLSPEMSAAIRSISRLWNASTLHENLKRFQKYQNDLVNESRVEEARSIQSYLEKINSEIDFINSNLNTEDQFKVFLMEKE